MKKDKKVIFRLDEDLASHFKAVCALAKKSQNEIFIQLVKEFVSNKKLLA